MEKPSKNIERLTDSWLKETELEQPSVNFVNSVMERIDARSKSKVYVPLISKRGWMAIAAIVVASIVLLYFFPLGEPQYINRIPVSDLPKFKNPFAGIQLSKTMVYSLGLLALFLVQIPFLKRQFVR